MVYPTLIRTCEFCYHEFDYIQGGRTSICQACWDGRPASARASELDERISAVMLKVDELVAAAVRDAQTTTMIRGIDNEYGRGLIRTARESLIDLLEHML